MNKEDKILLEVNNLSTSFFTEDGEVKAVRGVSLNVREGETLGFVGESGCGKSVTALSIMKLIPTPGRIIGGEVYYKGKDLLRSTDKEIREIRGKEIALIFQEPLTSLNPVFNIGNQIVEALRIHQNVGKNEAVKRAIAMLESVGIPEPQRRIKDYPHQLSGGMRQRAMIAMALSCNPNLLIADEPTTALDVTIQAQILELMESIQKERNMAMIFITHDLGIISETVDNVAVMYCGKIVEYTSTKT
ncbi:MAG: ABC transporter ATP-binding protein, partial [Candidatus Omnitrophica bacterium]|nr:ABC transporter ATP-binding protein [Candidatus Omnitrophota bacterium]